MRYSICILTAALFIFPATVGATPPEAITMNYDAKEKMLHIEVQHNSHNLRQHHLRRIQVLKNDEEVGTINLTTQTTPSSVSVTVPLDANPGDQITVEAQCNKSGPRQEMLTIP